jgi:hypothetical protein
MRWMELPQSEFEALPLTLEQCITIHREHFGIWPPRQPRSGILIFGYVKWPNDPTSRSDWWLTNLAFDRAPGPDPSIVGFSGLPPFDRADGIWQLAARAFIQLVEANGDYEKKWNRTAEIIQTVVDIAAEPRANARGRASLSKAMDLLECEPHQRGRSQLAFAWSEFRDVAHLLAARAYLRRYANEHSQSLASDSLLVLAAAYQDFGLTFRSQGQNESILSPKTLWRVPTWLNIRPIAAPPARPLREDQIRFLTSERRARKKAG